MLSVVALALTVDLSVPQALLLACRRRGSASPSVSHPDGVAAQHGPASPPVAWVLLVANMFWAIAYDTEYAMVDRDDDMRLGLKSSAILFGRYDVAGVMACHAIFLVMMAVDRLRGSARRRLLRGPRRRGRAGRAISTG